MAITTLAKPVGGLGNIGPRPYMVAVDIDFAAAATAAGTALVTTDIIECLTFEDPTLVLAAGIEAYTVDTGGTSATFDLGVTGVDVDYWVDGYDWVAASAGDFAAGPTAYGGPKVIGADDTIDLVCLGTTIPTAGTLRIWALLMDFTSASRAALLEAVDVDRDQLA